MGDDLSQALLRSLKEAVVVVDRNGIIVAANETWLDLSRAGSANADPIGPGASLLDSYRTMALPEGETLARLVSGIESVLHGSRQDFTMEYVSPLPGPRWFAMTVVALEGSRNGAIISHTDITGQKKFEDELRRTQEELAHSVRVSMMGELMASLAHELNQPLAAIRSNAQAALRFLAAPVPDLEEVHAALTEIVADDRWAAEVIRRLRMLVRRGTGERMRLDVNELLRDTLALVRTEAIERNVSVEFDPAPGLPPVLGDRVQLQQVLLNLTLNAVEAMEQPDSPKALGVRTSADDQGSVTVSVWDSGGGIDDACMERIFDAFYTTKPEGLGMGLSISQSIVKAHGGRLWAERNPDRGMTFHFSLPGTTA